MLSDKKISNGFPFLWTYYVQKNQKREWEKRLNHQAWMAFTTPAAIEEMVKELIVAYLEKNELAGKEVRRPDTLWLMLKMLSDWSWDKIVIEL